MNSTWHFRVSAAAASLLLVGIACSDASGDASGIGQDQPDADPGAVAPAAEGGTIAEDSGLSSDAATEADVAQTEPTCTDEGWCHTHVPDNQTLRAVWSDGQGGAWTVSEQGNILRWNGAAWVLSHSAGVPLHAVWGSSPTDLWAGGGEPTTGDLMAPGLLLHGTGASPSTITWKAIAAPVTIRSIWGTSATDVWAVASPTHRIRAGDSSFVLHYSGSTADSDAGDAGTGWEIDPVASAFPIHFEKVWGTAEDDVWVTGRQAFNDYFADGRVLHRRRDGDGGTSWHIDQPTAVRQPTLDGDRIVEIDGASVSRSHVFLVRFSRNDSSVYHTGLSTDDGATFTWAQQPTSGTGFDKKALSTVWGSGPNDIWMAGQLGRLRHWDGVKWRVAAVATGKLPVQKAVHAISGSGPNDVWVVGEGIALHKVAP